MFNKIGLANTMLAGMSRNLGVNADKCSRMRHKSSSCNLCESNCPVKAIKIGAVGTNITVDWDKCSGCGICVNVCPTAVYSIKGMPYLTFLDSCVEAIDNGSLRLVCAKVQNPPAGSAVIECLGMIGLTELLYFYTNGASRITLQFSDCASCVNLYGRDIMLDEIDELKNLTEYFEHLINTEVTTGREISISFPKSFAKPEIQKAPAAEQYSGISRREVFSAWRKNVQNTALKGAALFAPEKAHERTVFNTAEKHVPIKRRIFTDALVKCGKLLKRDKAVSGYFYGQEISSACNFCGVCTRFCPTGALMMNEEGNKILFDASKCVVCGMCRISCYHGYISNKKSIDLIDFFDEIIKIEKV